MTDPIFLQKVSTKNSLRSMSSQNLNPLPDGKILGLPKLKAFADDKSNIAQNTKLCFIG